MSPQRLQRFSSMSPELEFASGTNVSESAAWPPGWVDSCWFLSVSSFKMFLDVPKRLRAATGYTILGDRCRTAVQRLLRHPSWSKFIVRRRQLQRVARRPETRGLQSNRTNRRSYSILQLARSGIWPRRLVARRTTNCWIGCIRVQPLRAILWSVQIRLCITLQKPGPRELISRPSPLPTISPADSRIQSVSCSTRPAVVVIC